ncbi:hypothetical protein A3SI_10699 [Nitritalea halalkaliphila LW7]|uniref:DUF4097 domain-containing protein n=1 Tax=Nitritalea halalkaliphila LW7 TaxID=1189621 RepID=I5C377_9BACT|nr:DUF4097 family beta strand repeat-containing protein [Nitritalea halalkaliphila]EIM76279.1 hypothetical protein A3SI_10699 [Nitritalea halalkaliphila LW7]
MTLSGTLVYPEEAEGQWTTELKDGVLYIDFKLGSFTVFGWGGLDRPDKVVRIEGPEYLRLEAKIGSGSFDVRDLSHERIELSVSSGTLSGEVLTADRLEISCSSGAVKFEDIEADVELQVGSGAAQLRGVQGRLQAKVGSGALQLKDIAGESEVAVSSGVVNLHNMGALKALKVSSGVLNGKEITFAPGGAELQVSSGLASLQVDALTAYDYDLQVSSGNLRVGQERANGKRLELSHAAGVSVRGKVSSGSLTIK